MASNSTRRSLQTFVRQARPLCECANPRSSVIRQFSISRPRKDAEYETEGEQRPRWSYTPERMKAPYSYRIKDTTKAWECNSDPKRLDRLYINFLGRGGDKVLTDEIKWLAITHKSFDQGRRGFNDRLAFYGECYDHSWRSWADRTRPTDPECTNKYCFGPVTNCTENTIPGRPFR